MRRMLLFFGRGEDMKFKNIYGKLSAFEWALWIFSVAGVTLSFLLGENKDLLTLIASLIGVTALIFVAKGYVLGQLLTVAFAVFYGIISFFLAYYGEMITYLCMSAPIAALSVVSWLKNPYMGSSEVAVHKLTRKQWTVMALLAVAVTAVFYFILRFLGNAALLVLFHVQ